jgi:hypothetical protein
MPHIVNSHSHKKQHAAADEEKMPLTSEGREKGIKEGGVIPDILSAVPPIGQFLTALMNYEYPSKEYTMAMLGTICWMLMFVSYGWNKTIISDAELKTAHETWEYRKKKDIERSISYYAATFFSILTIGFAFALGFTAPTKHGKEKGRDY